MLMNFLMTHQLINPLIVAAVIGINNLLIILNVMRRVREELIDVNVNFKVAFLNLKRCQRVCKYNICIRAIVMNRIICAGVCIILPH